MSEATRWFERAISEGRKGIACGVAELCMNCGHPIWPKPPSPDQRYMGVLVCQCGTVPSVLGRGIFDAHGLSEIRERTTGSAGNHKERAD